MSTGDGEISGINIINYCFSFQVVVNYVLNHLVHLFYTCSFIAYGEFVLCILANTVKQKMAKTRKNVKWSKAEGTATDPTVISSEVD